MGPPLGARVGGAFPVNLHLAVLKPIPHRPIVITLAVFHLDRRGDYFTGETIGVRSSTAILLRLHYILPLGEECGKRENDWN